jgi:prepilin-type N-terminal cleavage/methylation domain-containing protein
MNTEQKHSGFSLTEVLIAIGILSVAMVFIAGVFPAGIYFATVATERTIAAVAADEAFAKIRIYAKGDLSTTNYDYDPNRWPLKVKNANALADFNDNSVFPATVNIDSNEFAYPSVNTDVTQKQYCWSALCGLTEIYNATINPNPPVQVTVFICRKANPNLEYRTPNGTDDGAWPVPVKVGVSFSGTSKNELQISSGKESYINDGYTIVDDATGRIYRVRERYQDDPATVGLREDTVILLDRDWEGGSPKDVWVVPPPVSGTRKVTHGRYPCIAVYQKVMQF